jgi:hypothetical protein
MSTLEPADLFPRKLLETNLSSFPNITYNMEDVRTSEVADTNAT